MQKGLKELQVVKVRHLAELRDLSNPRMVEKIGKGGSLTRITEANCRQPVFPDGQISR